MKIKTEQEALQAIEDDAATRAYTYLEREAPLTLDAIKQLINGSGWSADNVISQFECVYGVTEEKTRHKISLIAKALERERDN